MVSLHLAMIIVQYTLPETTPIPKAVVAPTMMPILFPIVAASKCFLPSAQVGLVADIRPISKTAALPLIRAQRIQKKTRAITTMFTLSE